MSNRGAVSGPATIQQMVSALRGLVQGLGGGSPEAAIAPLDTLERALGDVLAEHGGMAEELLRVYEQLGIVFEVTHQLPTVRDEHEVLQLFVTNLQATYPSTEITVLTCSNERWSNAGVTPAGTPSAARASLSDPLPPWAVQALRTCREEHRVVVAERREGVRVKSSEFRGKGDDPASLSTRNSKLELLRVMCGPIYAGEGFVGALLLAQCGDSLNPAGRQTDDGSGAPRPGAAGLIVRPFEASDMLLLDSLNRFCGDVIRNFRLLNELRQLSVDMVRALICAIEQKDEYTSGHSTRVGYFSTLLGKELGLSAGELQILEWAALLHDVGKTGIRDEVLKKPGKLTPEEFAHIQEHPVRSYQVVCEIPQLADALGGVTHHHEHWDGTGYPDGLKGLEIPLQARIIQLADIFDALTSTRSYRKAFDWQKALSILREEAGTTVDPHLVVIFDRMIRSMADHDRLHLERAMSMRRTSRWGQGAEQRRSITSSSGPHGAGPETACVGAQCATAPHGAPPMTCCGEGLPTFRENAAGQEGDWQP